VNKKVFLGQNDRYGFLELILKKDQFINTKITGIKFLIVSIIGTSNRKKIWCSKINLWRKVPVIPVPVIII
jgi:hypothetical protein